MALVWAQADEQAPSMVNLQAARAADAQALGLALESASTPEQRSALAAAFVERDAKRREQLAANATSRVDASPVANPVAVGKRFEGITDGTIKAAMIDRGRVADELIALREETANLDSLSRSKKYTEWQEKNAVASRAFVQGFVADVQKEARHGSSVPIEPPANLSGSAKVAWTLRTGLIDELFALRESTAAMEPGERAGAYVQWFRQNEGELENARQELKQNIRQR